MKLRSLRERELVSSIRGEFSTRRRDLVLGIGDDAAVVRGAKGLCLLTTDLLIEDVHFITSLHPPHYLGRKSLNVNLSDIAAMGGRPKYALLGLALRKGLTLVWVRSFFGGLKDAAEEAGVILMTAFPCRYSAAMARAKPAVMIDHCTSAEFAASAPWA